MNISMNQNAKEFLRADGRSIILLQDPSELTFTRSDNSLLISTRGGDEALVEDFFVLDESAALPVFVVESGESIEGADFLSGMNPQLDLATAAGPASSTAQGSGSGEYSDAAGDLIDGLDRLGSLGTSHWDMSLDTTEILLSDSSLLGVDSGSSLTPPVDPTIPPVTPPVDPPVDPPNPDIPKDFFVRGVMYNDENSTDSVSVGIFFPNDDGSLGKLGDSDINFSGQNPSARYHVEIGLPDGWDESWVDVNYNASSGRMEFTLTADGLAEMQRLGLSGDNLLDFIGVEVIDSANPDSHFGYLVEIVAGNNSVYDSAAQDGIDKAGAYPVDELELIGEFHHGKGQSGVYTITSSKKEDEIIIDDRVLGGSNIHGNPDTQNLYVDDSDMIFLNQGMETTGRGVKSTVSTAKGTVSISSESNDALSASNGGFNQINSGNIVIKSSAAGNNAMYATGGGSNLLIGTGGSTATITGTVHAVDYGYNGVNVTGSYTGIGDHIAKDGGTTRIGANSIEITGTVKAENSSSGPGDPDRLRSLPGLETKVILEAGEGGSVKVSGELESIGKGALVLIVGGEVSIIGDSTAISASRKGAVAVMASEGKLSVQATGKDDASSVSGITSQSGGEIEIAAKDMDVEVLQDGGVNLGYALSATGIAAIGSSDFSSNTINASGKLIVDVSSDASAGGIVAQGSPYSRNIIKAGELELIVKSTGEVSDSRVVGFQNIGGTNAVTIGKDASIDVSGKAFTAAFYNADSSSSDKQELTAGGDITVNVNSTAGEAFGMSGTVDISASVVTMTIKGDLSAIIMDGKGTITGDTITLTAESAHGTSYGMYNKGSASNIIQSEAGHALKLEINADYAMYASAGENSIIGNSISGGEFGDVISLNGKIYQSGTGANKVQTGSGDDIITINGAISGAISGAGAIYIDGGEGNDTLILKADSADDFIAKYGAWLNGLSAKILTGIEKIEFSGIEDLSELSPDLDVFFAYAQSANINISVQTSEDLLASSAAFAAEALEESALSDQDAESQDDDRQTGENEYADSSANYAASIAELDLSDLVRSGDSQDNLELSLDKIYTDESLSNESIFQNVTESVDIADMVDLADTNANELLLDLLLGETEESSSQNIQAEASEELVAAMPSDLIAAETPLEPVAATSAETAAETSSETAAETSSETAAATLAVASPSAFVGANTDNFRSLDEGSEQDMLIQLDILSNFN